MSGYGMKLVFDGCGFESNTVYWMDIFSHLFVVKIVMSHKH